MKVLIACEESQAVCIEMRKLGLEAWSCDILPCSGGHPEWHIQDDVLKHINDGWDLMIAHPPCTFLSHAGNGYFNFIKYGEKAIRRWHDRIDATEFFLALYNANIPKIYVENPMGFINSIIPATQIIHPFYFGDGDKKRTCLWLKNLPPLIHSKGDLFNENTHVEAKPIYFKKDGTPLYFTDAISGNKKDTHTLRSKTFPGIAKAMATQWGNYLIQKYEK